MRSTAIKLLRHSTQSLDYTDAQLFCLLSTENNPKYIRGACLYSSSYFPAYACSVPGGTDFVYERDHDAFGRLDDFCNWNQVRSSTFIHGYRRQRTFLPGPFRKEYKVVLLQRCFARQMFFYASGAVLVDSFSVCKCRSAWEYAVRKWYKIHEGRSTPNTWWRA